MDRLMMFSLTFCIAYIGVYYFNYPLFEYYPMTGEIRPGWDLDPAQQTIRWYGWLASSGLVGFALSWIVPRKWAARLSPDILWVVAVVLVIAVIMYERRWFV